MTRIFATLAVGSALALSACGQESADTAPVDSPAADAGIEQRAAPTPPPLVPPGEEVDATPLTPAGFGPYEVGEALPTTGPTAEITPRAGENCRLYRDPGLPGVTIQTDASTVTRVTAQAPATIITGAGVRVGSSEADVRAVYPELRQVPHGSDPAPAKSLYTAAAGEDGLRFDIGADGNVAAMHGGAGAALARGAGCS